MTAPRRAVIASAPTRLDFGGGWTDVPPFPEERGGFVCNVAISRRATARVTVGAPSLAQDPSTTAPDALARAALAHGAVTFGAIANVQVADAHVALSSDFPIGAGLGGSSAAGVALAAAVHALHNTMPTLGELAEWSREVEVEQMGIAGGRQDHYAAAFGGVLGLTFGTHTQVERITISQETRARLERQCLLFYTGASRISGETITAVLDAYRTRNTSVVAALDRMAALARQMTRALGDGDIDHLAALVDEHWHAQRQLHPRISTEQIDAIENAARRAGATGMKALGASGGGSVIVFAPDACVEAVSEAILPLAERLAWTVDDVGVDVAPTST
ncbi:MAG: hypothetical protein IT353_22895 [Gemmatimonadaceae bacterium]|nr:hypothetical protein [Gemmatimonadaceae bacterium]